MSITLKNTAAADVVYNIYRKSENRAEYIGPAHTDLSKDLLVVSSSSPKQTSTSFGNRRSTVNLLTTVSAPLPDGTSAKRDMKVEISVSLPAGVTFAILDEALSRIAHAITTDAIATDLLFIGKIDR
nr:MAG: hypothetical protein 2 [Leviviridae sp.]